MSTKNLARTVIEGGRSGWSKHRRRDSHRDARAKARKQLGIALRDAERADDLWFDRREPVYKDFRDKLSPADRWMRKQVGRPWWKVEGELLKLFDTRTTAGRHVVFCHMMRRPSVWNDGSWHVDSTSFYVDTKGFLRTTTSRWKLARKQRATACELQHAQAWAGKRKVIVHGTTYYWAEPTDGAPLCEDQRYRQGRRLEEEESRYFDRLSDRCRELVTTGQGR